MISTVPITFKTVGAYEAKTKLPELLAMVESGQSIMITRHAHPIARLVPVKEPTIDQTVFSRIREIHSRLSLPKGETARDLINAGRRI